MSRPLISVERRSLLHRLISSFEISSAGVFLFSWPALSVAMFGNANLKSSCCWSLHGSLMQRRLFPRSLVWWPVMIFEVVLSVQQKVVLHRKYIGRRKWCQWLLDALTFKKECMLPKAGPLLAPSAIFFIHCQFVSVLNFVSKLGFVVHS